MNLYTFISLLKDEIFTDKELRKLIGNKSVRHIVSSPISLHVVQEYDFDISQSILIEGNLNRINAMIEKGDAYFLQYKKQSLADIFSYEGHNKKNVDPILDVRMSSSFF